MTKKYYLGLDIGTDSVGYAVTDEYYQLIKYKREPIYGVHTFDAASTSEKRRSFRIARRRLDRRQQRITLLNELFASEIEKVDQKFFTRRMESYLLREEATDSFTVFADDNYTDVEYHSQYPTIHHLICELMDNDTEHDVRLVYLACAWLVAHRGHFLLETTSENISDVIDFDHAYNDFCAYMADEYLPMPWPETIDPSTIRDILTTNTGVTKKSEAFIAKVFDGKSIPKYNGKDGRPYSTDVLIRLLSGGKIKPSDLFCEENLGEIDSVSLKMDEENFSRIVNDIGEKGELIVKLRALQDCASLIEVLNGCKSISEAKVQIYEQHEKDLSYLKRLVKKYIPNEYNNIFKNAVADNYVAYSYNIKSCKNASSVKKTNAENFCAFLKIKLKNIEVEESDKALYDDMMQRIETSSFMPKQKTGDNRVIPQQLYKHELITILNNAEKYLPMLKKKTEDGISNKDKILSIFNFKIPYYVGPLCGYKNANCWIVRKGEGRIYPWNFENIVDFDACEQAFISRMTNTCTYLAGEPVLPVKSLKYCKYTVLNEINNIKVNSYTISVEAKQAIFNELFMRYKKVTVKQIRDFLFSNGYIQAGDELSGIDIKVNSSLSSYHIFKRLLESALLTESDVEKIILHAAYSEDKSRFKNWLSENFSHLSEQDKNYIIRQNLKEFGRLSDKFLTGVFGSGNNNTTGEALSIIDALWETNDNLMQLMSANYSYKDTIIEFNRDYYSEHSATLSERLDEMYISNAVKRPIYRTFAICSDIVNAMGCPPDKIFVEMARGASEDQRGQRARTRKQQLIDIYNSINNDDAKALKAEIEAMGETADNRLQSELLYLYYLQMGKSAYTGKSIDISKLYDGRTYNREHIYPQSFVKDDSILNNKVLVESVVNEVKGDNFPINFEIRERMTPIWQYWLSCGLISQEKYRRLTRSSPFSEAEKWEFINRQIVETRQSTKAISQLLNEKYPDSEIVYVKAGLVSEFRQAFDLVKCRAVNNLHHGKDAYLNIVVGNVYNSKFNKRYFDISEKYNVQAKKLFKQSIKCGASIIWQGETDIARIKEIMRKNCIHVTRYSYCKHGKLFGDGQAKKAKEGLIPLKKEMATTKYGGYNGASIAFFVLAKYSIGKTTDIMFVPIELTYSEKFAANNELTNSYIEQTISKMKKKPAKLISLPLGYRIIKPKTVLSLDGLKVTLNSKYDDTRISISILSPLILASEEEKYIKQLETFEKRKKENSKILPDKEHDHISADENIKLYNELIEKMALPLYAKCSGNLHDKLIQYKNNFIKCEVVDQVNALLNIVAWFSTSTLSVNLKGIGGATNEGKKNPTISIASWKKNYTDVRIIDQSASGLYEGKSVNLLSFL